MAVAIMMKCHLREIISTIRKLVGNNKEKG